MKYSEPLYTVGDTVSAVVKDIENHAHNLTGYMTGINDWTIKHPDWNVLFGLTGQASLLGLLVVTLLVLIWTAGKYRPKVLRKIKLKWVFCAVWVYGFLVYDIGMCTGEKISLITNAPMAILYAFKIFLFDSDVSEIHEAFHSSWAYSLNFALVHFLAATISTLFVIKHFGFNILSRIKMKMASCWPCRKVVSETYVFWGFNESVYHLVKSIQQHYGESKDYRVIIVNTNKDNNDNPEEKTGFSRIFNFLSMPTSELDRLQSLRCFTDCSYVNISTINVKDNVKDVIGKLLDMKSLKKLLRKCTKQKIHMLFLSENDKDNIHDVSLLLNDETIRDFTINSEREVIFYCHARYNSVHRVIEDQIPTDKIKVRVVDSSHVNVEMLKQNKDLLPVNYVDVEADATVSSSFNALVVGFSEVGQDSARFLYEFGAFVKNGSTDNHVVRSGFHMHVVDKNMSDLAGTFVANAPAIKPSMPFIKDGENSKALITLHEMDCRSVEFYLKLETWIKTMNYVVIATEDDELNISLAVRVFKAAARYRKDMDKFCILVRAHNDEDGHIRRIAGHYNRLWAAYECAPEVNNKRIHQNSIKVNDEIKSPIYIFGLDRKTYTYDNIIGNAQEIKARKYKAQYEKTIYPKKTFNKSPWDDFYIDIMQLDGEWKGYSPTYWGLINLRRCQSQDFANSEHEITKSILKDKALEKCGLKDYSFTHLSRTQKYTKYSWPLNVQVLNEINRIAIVLAQTEHLRWNASHEILGYVDGNTKDEVRLVHNCLKDWDCLSEEVRSYDCNISDLILGITIK